MPKTFDHSFDAFVVEATFLGKTAALALGDGTVRLIEGQTTQRVEVHSGAILSAMATRDGKALITGGDDGRVARVEVGGAVSVLAERPRKWIDHVATGPGGAVGYTCGRQAFVLLGERRERDLTFDRAAGGIAFAPKGLRLAIAGYGGVTLWWAGTDAEPIRLDWKGAHLTADFSPDGRFVVTTMQENALHAWRVADGLDMHMSGYTAKTRSLAWSAKARYLATSGSTAAILWPFQSKEGPAGKEPVQLGTHGAQVTMVACHPRKDTIAIGYQDGSIALVEMGDRSEVVIRPPGGSPVSALAFDSRGGGIAFGTEDGAAGVVRLEN